jgi:hypothetical protein
MSISILNNDSFESGLHDLKSDVLELLVCDFNRTTIRSVWCSKMLILKSRLEGRDELFVYDLLKAKFGRVSINSVLDVKAGTLGNNAGFLRKIHTAASAATVNKLAKPQLFCGSLDLVFPEGNSNNGQKAT